MPKFIIERELPGAGGLTAEDLRMVSRNTSAALEELGPEIQWVESYVTDHKMYCIYLAPDDTLLREHSARAGLPANRISRVRQEIAGDAPRPARKRAAV